MEVRILKLSEISKIIDAEVLCCEAGLSTEISSAYGCDLMSDVLAFASDQEMLLTGLLNTQTVRTAEMMDIKAITFVRGKKPGGDVIELASEKGITLLSTSLTMFEACGMLYSAGLGREKGGE